MSYFRTHNQWIQHGGDRLPFVNNKFIQFARPRPNTGILQTITLNYYPPEVPFTIIIDVQHLAEQHTQQYTLFEQSLVSIGFRADDMQNKESRLTLDIPLDRANKDLLLRSLREIDPTFEDILDVLNDSIAMINPWRNRYADIQRTSLDQLSGLNPSRSFPSRYVDGFSLAQNLPENAFYELIANRVDFFHNLAEFRETLELALAINGEDLDGALDIALGIPYRNNRRTFPLSFFQTPPQDATPLDIIGEHAKTLDTLHILTEDIPPEMCCLITCDIMTTPVFDPRNPDQKFEKLAILAALRHKSENPYTREPLDALGLVEDDELKKCIDSFVAEKISAAERHSEP